VPVDLVQAATGWRIAKDQCSACHAIDATSPSPRPEAPPLRHVLELYPEEMLAERFIEGVRIGHDEMPKFDFTVRAADALVAYLKSIRSPTPADRETAPGS
jgi:mono/diheme cytochrome c family protein